MLVHVVMPVAAAKGAIDCKRSMAKSRLQTAVRDRPMR